MQWAINGVLNGGDEMVNDGDGNGGAMCRRRLSLGRQRKAGAGWLALVDWLRRCRAPIVKCCVDDS